MMVQVSEIGIWWQVSSHVVFDGGLLIILSGLLSICNHWSVHCHILLLCHLVLLSLLRLHHNIAKLRKFLGIWALVAAGRLDVVFVKDLYIRLRGDDLEEIVALSHVTMMTNQKFLISKIFWSKSEGSGVASNCHHQGCGRSLSPLPLRPLTK